LTTVQYSQAIMDRYRKS